MNSYPELKGKVVVITGAAHGIGKALAIAFAEAHAKVVIVDIDRRAGEALSQKLQRSGFESLFIYTDLRKEEQIKKAVQLTKKHFKRIDVIINNARPRLTKLTLGAGLKEWDAAMDVLLKAPAMLVHYALSELIKNKGQIINMTSTNSFSVSQQPLVYHVAKAGIVQMTRYLAYEFGPQGLRVNAICPALVDVPDEAKPSLTADRENEEVIKSIVPLQRAAKVKEIAQSALFLCSEQSSYLTGQVLLLDGGLMLGEPFRLARKTFLKGKHPNHV